MLQITVARNLWERITGLIGRRLGWDEGLFIPRCRQVHTWFMGRPLDVVLVDSAGIVVAVFSQLAPWRVTPRRLGAVHCLELPSGAAERHRLRAGETIPYQVLFSLMSAGAVGFLLAGGRNTEAYAALA